MPEIVSNIVPKIVRNIVPKFVPKMSLKLCPKLTYKFQTTMTTDRIQNLWISKDGVETKKRHTVRPRDTRPQAARTSQVHVFELGPKIFEVNKFM